MSQYSPALSIRVKGPIAVFTDPTMKVERMSSPVMTPSAARGLVESILWKPAIRWHVERIKVLAPIRFISFRRNEVNSRVPTLPRALIRDGGMPPMLVADEDRAQRNTVALRDVDYVVDLRFSMTKRAGSEDNVAKFVDMFQRRVEKGQHFAQPYLGCREFPAEVTTSIGAPDPIPETRTLGNLLWDIEFDSSSGNRPIFFAAELVNGILVVPPELIERARRFSLEEPT
ncbi:type I-C CRISPR-associated protein Cas5c [soil metagenome]